MSASLPGNIVVGTDWLGPVTSAKCEWQLTLNGDKVTIYYRDVWTNGLWRTRVPDVTAALGFTVAGNFVTATARQIDPGVLCEVQIVYALASGGYASTPASTMSENADGVNESITKHSNFNAASGAGTPSDANSPWKKWWNPATKAFDPGYLPPGVVGPPSPMPDYLIPLTDFAVGSSTITVLDYFTSEPDDVEPMLGKIGTPPGKTAGNYLLRTGGKNPSGQFWQRRLVYQYSSLPVPTQVYPTL